MAYFPPYIDETGLHMPTYEERLENLVSAYRSIFGIESELSDSVPDYQLLSVLARALDDTSALVLDAYNSRNPFYARGQGLDLLLPQYGLTRLPGETDAEARNRMVASLAGNGRTMAENIRAEIAQIPYVVQSLIHVNDTGAADAQGVPAHSLCCVVEGGALQKIAEAIFRKKAPGIGTWGNKNKTVTDENGNTHTVYFSRPDVASVTFDLAVTSYTGYDDSVPSILRQAIVDYIAGFRIGESLIVPSVYGVCYAAAAEKAGTFAITDLSATCSILGGTTRIKVPANWNTRLDCLSDQVHITVTPG